MRQLMRVAAGRQAAKQAKGEDNIARDPVSTAGHGWLASPGLHGLFAGMLQRVQPTGSQGCVV